MSSSSTVPQSRSRRDTDYAIVNITTLPIHTTKQSTRVSLHTGSRIHLYPIILPIPSAPLHKPRKVTHPKSQPKLLYQLDPLPRIIKHHPALVEHPPRLMIMGDIKVLPRQQAHSLFPVTDDDAFARRIHQSSTTRRPMRTRPCPILAVYTRTACVLGSRREFSVSSHQRRATYGLAAHPVCLGVQVRLSCK